MSVCAWESLAEAWVDGGLPQGQGIAYNSPRRPGVLAKVLLKEVAIIAIIAIIAITPTIVWPQLQGGNAALHPSAEHWIK